MKKQSFQFVEAIDHNLMPLNSSLAGGNATRLTILSNYLFLYIGFDGKNFVASGIIPFLKKEIRK